MSESVLNFLEEKNLPEVTKKKHTYLMMDGHDQEDIYVLKDGVVKVSIVLCDGREFNITYLKGLDMISLLKDEINKMTTASFHARIESDTATFYRINRKLFEQYVKENEELQAYIDSYYRKKDDRSYLSPATHDNEWEKWSCVCIYLSFDSIIW